MSRGDDLQVLSVYEALSDLPPAEALAELERLAPPEPIRERVRRMLLADEEHTPLFDSVGPDVMADALARDLVRSIATQPADGAAATVPATLGPYRVLGLLGAGAMGVVYEAEQAQPRRAVAIKVVREVVGDEAARSRFRHEAQVLATLRHPTIPYVVEAAEYEGLGYVVMERVVGQSLDVWARGRSLEERLAVFRQLCAGVAYAQDAGVLHRDLKPANILIEASGQPRILDFGLSVLAKTAATADLAGTVPYLPPEALDGSVNAQADVYALGVILYELVHDRLPWTLDGLTAREALRLKRVPIPATDAPHVPPATDAIARRAAAPDPAQRYPTAAALYEDLLADRDHRPVSAWQPSLRARALRWARRNRVGLRWAVGSTLGVALLVGTAAGARAAARAAADAKRQELAWQHYAVVRQRVADLRAAGEEERAEAAFEALGERRENQDTEALAQAWLDEARRRASLGDEDGQIDALATALSGRSNAVIREAIVLDLAKAFAARLDWEALALLTAEIADADLRRSYELAVEAGRRRLDAAGDPVLASWALATRTRWRPIWAQTETWNGEEKTLLLDQDANVLVVADPTDLDGGRAWPLPPMGFGWDAPRVTVLGDRVWASALVPGDELRWRLLSASTTDPELRFTEVLAGDAGAPSPVVAGDLDQDGAPWLYLGSGPPQRRVRAVDPAAPRLRVPHLGSDAAASDLSDLFVADLDGDGRDELTLALGAWQAFDVRVLHVPPGGDEDAGLALRARRQLGGRVHLGRLTRPDGEVVVVASKADQLPSVRVFGPERPLGDPTGLYLLRLRGDTLEEELFLPMPTGNTVRPARVYSGDTDGDGLEDLVVNLSADAGTSLWLLRQAPDGSFTSRIVSGLVPLGLVQADADPARELLARVPDDDEHLWVLGAGDTPLPARPARRGQFPPTGSERADLLRRLGMTDLAATLLERLGQTEDDLDRLARYLRTAAGLRAELGDHDRALADLHTARRLRALPDAADAELLRDQVRVGLEGHRPAEAREALAELRTHPAAGDRSDVEGAAAAVSLERSVTRRFDLTDPRAVPWEVADPTAVRFDPDGVRLGLIDGGGPSLRLPLVRDGGPFGVWLDAQIVRGDPGAGIRVALTPADGGSGAALDLGVWGGSRRLSHDWRCVGEGLASLSYQSPFRDDTRRWNATFRLMALGDRLQCEGKREGKLDILATSTRIPVTAERWTLTIGASTTPPPNGRGLFELVLHELVLEGARPDGTDPGWALAWLQDGDPRRLADVAAADPALAAVLAGDAGLPDEATALTRRVARSGRAPVPAVFIDALRRNPGVWTPLVRDHWPIDAFAAAYAEAWTVHSSGVIDAAALSTLDHPFVDDLPVNDDTFELLAYRAVLLERAGRRRPAHALLERLVATPTAPSIGYDDSLLQLATLEVHDGDLAAARARCATLLARSATPHLVQDRIRRSEALAGPCGDLPLP